MNDLFFNQINTFKSNLIKAKSFDEIKSLWMETSIPYDMPENINPFSDQYRNIQLNLYRRLADKAYSSLNEMTSTKQTAIQFEKGFPWVTKNLDLISSHMAKVAQAISAIAKNKKNDVDFNIIEYGSGWGNLAIPLAKSSLNVTCIDIDKGFLDRIEGICTKEGITIELIESDFEMVDKKVKNNIYDCAIFQSSFHHCLNFSDLLLSIKNTILNDSGEILFLDEPIFHNYKFPWGLRFDGESLWAITCNSWLELGFDFDFFSLMCLNNGFFVSKINGIEPFVGNGYRASQVNNGIQFNNWLLPSKYHDTWHFANNSSGNAFSKNISKLPGLKDVVCDFSFYEIELINYAPHDLTIEVEAENFSTIKVNAGEKKSFKISAICPEVVFKVKTYIPAILINNGDTRDLGFCLNKVTIK
jgi:2-polyprenyl-3-methyl-5-hydroxy-6-metoxy-1,4-benzoquinol methylase